MSPTDLTGLTDERWASISKLIPAAKPGGRPRSVVMRAVLNALFYVSRTGCAWRMLPTDFPPKDTVYTDFKAFRIDDTWEKNHDVLRRRVRVINEKKPLPAAGILDAQSVKTSENNGLIRLLGAAQ